MNKVRHICALTLLMLWSLDAMTQKELGALPDMQVAMQQSATSGTRLSAEAAMLCTKLEQLGRDVKRNDTELIKQYALFRKGCRYNVLAAVTLTEGHEESELKQYGVKKYHRTGDHLTVQIPTRRLVKLVSSGIAAEIDISLTIQAK